MFERAVAALRLGPNIDRRSELDLAGAANIRRAVMMDTNLAPGESTGQ
jgi:hypothetical protein